MKRVFIFSPIKQTTLCFTEFSFVKNWGGGALIVWLLSFSSAFSQNCPLGQIEFEITRVVPQAPWKALSLPPNGLPGAFQAFYEVRLKAKAGNLPTTLPINYLTFSGQIQVNGFTSKINTVLTQAYLPSASGPGQTALGQFLDLSVLDQGEIVWQIGTESTCQNGEPATNLSLPLNVTSVRLFTIVVDAYPGDLVKWTNYGAFLDNCFACQGNIPVNAVGNSTDILMPAPATNPSPLRLNFDFAYAGGLLFPSIRIFAENLPSGFGKVDGVVHLIPDMVPSHDLEPIIGYFPTGPQTGNSSSGGHNLQTIIQKNDDGSFDIYFSFENYPDPDADPPIALDDPQLLFGVIFDGLYNASQGGFIHCSMRPGRWTLAPLASNPVTYPLLANSTTIDIPGHEICSPDITLIGTTYKNGQDCSTGVRFEFSHNQPTPVELDFLKFDIVFATGAGVTAVPGAISSDLDYYSTSGSFSQNTNNGFYTYHYEHLNPITLESGTYIDFPFQVSKGCFKYYVTLGECAITNNASGTCALSVLPGDDVCDPRVKGRVSDPDDKKVTYYEVQLESINNGNYELELEDNADCLDDFSFCPDPNQAPFRLRVINTNPNLYLPGVTTYDCVLISKHALGIEDLGSPYKRIAANALLENPNSIPPSPEEIKQSDITAIRLCILGVYNNFRGSPLGNSAPSWYYIQQGMVLPPDPLDTTNPDWRNLGNVSDVPPSGQGNYGNFYAVKVGDVNFSFSPNICGSSRAENFAYLKTTSYSSKTTPKRIYQVISSDAPFDLIAMQNAFRYDPTMYTLVNIIPNPDLPIFLQAHFNNDPTEQGEIRFAWHSFDGFTLLPSKAELFTLEFEQLNPIAEEQSTIIWTSDMIIPNLVYDKDGSEYSVRLGRNNDRSSTSGGANWSVRPNPFSDQFEVFLYTENESDVKLKLFNSKGVLVFEQSAQTTPGDQILEVHTTKDAPAGVYYLQLEHSHGVMTRRLIKL